MRSSTRSLLKAASNGSYLYAFWLSENGLMSLKASVCASIELEA